MNQNIEAVREMMAAALPTSQKPDADTFIDRKRKERQAREKLLTPSQQCFLETYHYGETDFSAQDAMRAALSGGQYAKPSDYVNTLDWLFPAIIPEASRQEALDAVDRCLTQPYAQGWKRRSLRSGNPAAYAESIRLVLARFAQDVLLPYDVADVLTENVPEEVQLYLRGSSWQHQHAALSCRIAGVLDRGDMAVENAIRDILTGEGQTVLMREVVMGVVQSGRSDMHALLGKLLIAARLQEGLRQVICESADQGTESAFMALLAVIEENNLIRFSAVKRAVGTWIGLISDESGDLERVSGKSVTLIRRCLTEEAFREECLASEDSMALHIALWAIGFRDVNAAVQRAAHIALAGTHHQRLTCGFFLGILNEPDTSSWLARQVIPAFADEPDTLALYLPQLTPRLLSSFYTHSRQGTRAKLSDYYADEAECRRMVALLLKVREGFKKKLIFDPCVFPGYSAQLDKSSITEKILSTAVLLEDDALLDSLLPLLPETPVDGSREYLLNYCCGNPRTPAQRRTLLTALCDKGEWVRKAAVKLTEKLPLLPEDFPVLESLLRYKYADARPVLLHMLLQQEDEALYGTICRLIADKLEEKRIAALDMVRTLAREDRRAALVGRCRPLIAAFDAPTAKEAPLLKSIRELLGETETDAASPDQLFGKEDVFRPVPATYEPLLSALETYARYFPDSRLPQDLASAHPQLKERRFTPVGDLSARDQAQEDIASLTKLVLEHASDEVESWHGATLFGALHDPCDDRQPGSAYLFDVWKGWYETALGSDPLRLLRACILMHTLRSGEWTAELQLLFGTGFHEETLHQQSSKTALQVGFLLIHLVNTFLPETDRHHLALSLMCWILIRMPENRLWGVVSSRIFGGQLRLEPFRALQAVTIVLSGLSYTQEDSFTLTLNTVMSLHLRMALVRKKLTDAQPELQSTDYSGYSSLSQHCSTGRTLPNLPLLLRAAWKGLISRKTVYASLFTLVDQRQGMQHLSLLSSYHRLQGAKPAADQWWHFARTKKELLTLYLGHAEVETGQDAALLRFADEVCQPLLRRVIDAEISRGAAAGEYTRLAGGVTRVDGAEHFIRILAALGKDKLLRGHSYASINSRADSLCMLLRCCHPLPEDTGDGLRSLMNAQKISSARLIEAALYVPDWIELTAEALEMPAFTSAAYYFMAHMNEDFDEARMARIARYTPLTADELNHGAFDVDWFRSAYADLGEAAFNLVYDAAKYITDGAKHARARKYADAVLGRLDAESVKDEIIAKRNKDLLMAWPLIPLSGDADVQARYLYLQQFLKESRSFGAQRAASEKTAVGVALQHLAMNAGYADAMRLTLRMESRLTEENAALFAPHEVEGVTLRLTVDEQGLAAIECLKSGKPQKSIPAKLKKHDYVLRLTEMKKQLTDQQKRARRMLEEAMENGSVFTAGEIAALMANPVIAPMLQRLVFMQGERFGFTDGLTLTDAEGVSAPLHASDALIIAHPFHLWQAKVWLAFQRRLFDGRIVQPFRQVFRELYIQTPEEATHTTSLRYAGHQLQPRRTLACLKTRRWIADPEAGLQKVYYRENLIATIWALADWFSPADIEAPTLEHVAFLDRKTGKPIEIGKVPPVLFSEVMRDVDLAVSVAHAGGIDPESSHSTIEMRAALLSFTLPLFRLTNVVIQGSHALIDGEIAKYSVHLGSGVVHQRGGAMLSVLPVHSQHRGRLFLPFADDDPKTAEILSKVLLFAEDGKIKDPTILEQIIR